MFACLPPTEVFRRGGRDLELKLEWAHSGLLVSLPCVIIEDTDVGSYCEVVGERSVQGLESPGLLGEVCVSCILQRGRVHGSPSTRASPGTWERYALWEAAHQLSVARPPSLGVILRPHKWAVLSACFLKTLYASQLLPGVRTERRDTGDEVCPESSIRR